MKNLFLYFKYTINIVLLSLLVISCNGGGNGASESADNSFTNSQQRDNKNSFTNAYIKTMAIDIKYVNGIHTFYAKSISEDKIIFNVPIELGEILSITLKKITTTEEVLSYSPQEEQTINFKNNTPNLFQLNLKDGSKYTLNIEINQINIDNDNLFINELKLFLLLGNTSNIYEGVIDEKSKTITFYLNYQFIFTVLNDLRGVISLISLSDNAETNIEVGNYLYFENNNKTIVIWNKEDSLGYKSYNIKVAFLPANELNELYSLQAQIQSDNDIYKLNADINNNDVVFTINQYHFDIFSIDKLDIISFDISNYASLSSTSILLTNINSYQKTGAINVVSESGKINKFDLLLERLANNQTDINDMNIEFTFQGTLINLNAKILKNNVVFTVDDNYIDFNLVDNLKVNNITLTHFATIHIDAIPLFNNMGRKAYGQFEVTLENKEQKKYELLIGRNINNENELINAKIQVQYQNEMLIFPLHKNNNTFSFLTQISTYDWNLIQSIDLIDYQLSSFAVVDNSSLNFKQINAQTIRATIQIIAENLDVQEYEIILQRPISSFNTINTLKIQTNNYNDLKGVVDQQNQSISFEMPYSTGNILDYTQLKITDIDLKYFATIESTNILLENINQITNAGTLNVTAENGSIKHYKLLIHRKLNDQNKIQNLTLKLFYAGQEYELYAEYDANNNRVNVELPVSLEELLNYTGEMTLNDIQHSIYSIASIAVNQSIDFIDGKSSIGIKSENGKIQNYQLLLVLTSNYSEAQIMYERFISITPINLDLNKSIIDPIIKDSNIKIINDKTSVIKKEIKEIPTLTVNDKISNKKIQKQDFKMNVDRSGYTVFVDLYRLFDQNPNLSFGQLKHNIYCTHHYENSHLFGWNWGIVTDSWYVSVCRLTNRSGSFHLNIENVNKNMNIRKLNHYLSSITPNVKITDAKINYSNDYSNVFSYSKFFLNSSKKNYFYLPNNSNFKAVKHLSINTTFQTIFSKRHESIFASCSRATQNFLSFRYIDKVAVVNRCMASQPNFDAEYNLDLKYVNSSEEHSLLPLEYLPTNFQSNEENGYVFSSNNVYLNYEPWKAANLAVYKKDQNPLQWLAVSNNNQDPYWQIELPKPKVLKYLLLAGPDYDTLLPSGELLLDYLNPQSFHIDQYSILGSNDGKYWDDLSGEINTPIEFLSFSEVFLRNQKAYKFYRIQAYNLQDYGGISQLKMAFESEVILHNIDDYNKKLLAKYLANYNSTSLKKELTVTSSSENKNKDYFPLYDNYYNQQEDLYWSDSRNDLNPYWQISLSSTMKTLTAFSFFTPNKSDANTEYRILGSNTNNFDASLNILTITDNSPLGWISNPNIINAESFHNLNNFQKYQNYRIEWKVANQKTAYLKRVKLYFKEDIYNNKFKNNIDLIAYSVINHLPVYYHKENKDILNYQVTTSSSRIIDEGYKALSLYKIPWIIDNDQKDAWWQIDLLKTKTLLGYSFKAEKLSLDTNPFTISITLQGANDNLWEDIHTKNDGSINVNNKTTQVFKIENPNKFNKYRIVVTKMNANKSIAISDINFTFLEEINNKNLHVMPSPNQITDSIKYANNLYFNLLINTLEKGFEVWKSKSTNKNIEVYNIMNISDLPIFKQANEKGYSIASNSVYGSNHPYYPVSDNIAFAEKNWRAINNRDVHWSIKLPQPKTLKWLYLKGVRDQVIIKNFKIQGSNDAADWQDITANFPTYINYHRPKVFYLLNEENYIYYRIYINDSTGNYPGFSKINMLFKEDNNEIIVPNSKYKFYNTLANIYEKFDLLNNFDSHLPIFNDGEFEKEDIIISSSNENEQSLLAHFDNNTQNGEYWLDDKDNTISWFKIKMPSKKILRFISFIGSGESDNTTYFTEFQIQGSNDNDIWDNLTSILNEKLDDSKEHKFIIPNRKYYKSYRILFLNKANPSKAAGFTNFKAQFLNE